MDFGKEMAELEMLEEETMLLEDQNLLLEKILNGFYLIQKVNTDTIKKYNKTFGDCDEQ